MDYRMPVIVREGGWSIWIYLNDHAPPHVHVRRRGGTNIKILLPSADKPVEIVNWKKVDSRQVLVAARLVIANASLLINAWERIHGLSADHR
jgi:hypothetical protein